MSEAEWEYAAQAGTGREAAVTLGKGEANCIGCARRLDMVQQWDARQTMPVGSFVANAFGLHDILGNVSEWTSDCVNSSHAAARADGSPRITGDCSRRVLRGGSWNHVYWSARSAYRVTDTTGDRSVIVGFRVARTL